MWAFHGLVTTNRRRYLPLAALALAGLLLSHNISAMIFAPLLGAYLVFLVVLRDRESGNQGIGELGNREVRSPGSQSPDSLVPRFPDSPIFRIVAAIALGLGLSAFFWLPAFGERDLIRLSGITTGFFDFRYNFISLAELLALPRPLDLSAINPYFPLSLGLAQMVFAALALLAIALHYVSRFTFYVLRITHHAVHITHHALSHTLFFAAALLVTLFLTLPYSRPIWETVPLLELAEFPWRWLGPATLCAAVLAGATLYMFEGLGAGGWGLGAGCWGLGAYLDHLTGGFQPHDFDNHTMEITIPAGLKSNPLIQGKMETEFGVGQCIVDHHAVDVPSLGRRGFEKLEPGWNIVEEILDGDGGARRDAFWAQRHLLSPFKADLGAGRLGGNARDEAQPRDGGDGGQRFAAKTQGGDAFQVFDAGQLTGGVAGEGDRHLVGGDTFSVIADTDQAASALARLNTYGPRTGVDGILHQFLDHRGGALHHLTGCDFGRHFGRQHVDGHSYVLRLPDLSIPYLILCSPGV